MRGNRGEPPAGVVPVTRPLGAMMAAFDALPPSVRAALDNAPIVFAPVKALLICQQKGERVALASIRLTIEKIFPGWRPIVTRPRRRRRV